MADLAVWQRTIVDEEGNVIPGAEIEVRREEDGSLATLYADRAGETPLANPLAADMSGFVRFFAQGDAYTITAVGAGSTRTWRFDPTGRLQEFDKVVAEIVTDDASEQAGIRDKLDAVARSANLSDLTDLKEARANLGTFSTDADVQNSHIPPVLDSIRTNGYYEPGDGGGALYRRVSVEPDHAGKIQSADGAWWELRPSHVIRPEMLGAFPHIVCEAETKAWYDACGVKPTYLHLMHTDRFIRRLKWRGIWGKITGLWVFAGHDVADVAINLKSPGTYDAEIQGGIIFQSGYGITGDGSSGYATLAPWSSLLAQNGAFIGLYSLPGTSTGYVVSSLTTGSGGGVAINPRDGNGNQVARLNSNSNQTAPVAYRGGVRVLSRSSSGFYQTYDEGWRLRGYSVASVAVTSDTASLLRSNTVYADDTVRALVTGNEGLDERDADALSYCLRLYVDGLAGTIGEGPSCDVIGFAERTVSADMAAALTDAAKLSARLGLPVELGYGAYVTDLRFPILSGAKIRGVHRRGSILRSSQDADQNEPLIAPPDYNGGHENFSAQHLTLDMAVSARGYTSVGNQRPGGSGVSTNGAGHCVFEELDILDPDLHGIDITNTGIAVAGGRSYADSPSDANRRQGIPSHDITCRDILVENQTDDSVTVHYSHDWLVDGVTALYDSGRHPGAGTMAFEADDGAYKGVARNIYARGIQFGAAAKRHVPHPSPSNVRIENINCFACYGRGLWIAGDDSGMEDHGANIVVDGLTYVRPLPAPPYASAPSPFVLHVTSQAKNISIRNVAVRAVGDEDYLGRCFHISGAVKDVTVDGFSILNWIPSDDADQDLTAVRVTGNCEDVTVQNGVMIGVGKYGLWDSGSTRADYQNIRVEGTDVTDSIGFWLSGGATANGTTHRALKVIGGFDTDETIT